MPKSLPLTEQPSELKTLSFGIYGEKEEKKECEEGKCCEAKNVRYIRREFSCSKFRQTLLLPENAERDEIKARVENGILHICIPKMVKPKTEEEKREIEIR